MERIFIFWTLSIRYTQEVNLYTFKTKKKSICRQAHNVFRGK